MDGHGFFLLLYNVIDHVIDGGADLMVVARAFVSWDIVGVPIHEAAHSAAFAFVVFPFAFAMFAFSFVVFSFAFSFWFSGLPDVVCIATARFDVCRQVAILVDKVVGELCEVAREDVIVVDLPGGDESVELWPPLYRFFEGLDLGDVRHWLVEAA